MHRTRASAGRSDIIIAAIPAPPDEDVSKLYLGNTFIASKHSFSVNVTKLLASRDKPANAINELNYNGTNQAPLSISADGTSMILFIDGKLSRAEKNIYNKWEIQNSFPETINSGKWQADARITSDKKALIFSSIRSTNLDYYPENNLDDYHSNRNYPSDIYVSVLDEDDNWGAPINLGPTINTIYSDRSPFLHPDMRTLYFASDGHGGLGNYDLFKSTRLYDTCWDCWSEPINLGKEFNTINGDWGLDISTDGEKAFLSKGIGSPTKNVVIKNNNDIFWSKVPAYLRPDYVATINGKLLDNKNQPVVANIRWEDLEAKKTIGIAKSDPEDGSYFIVLPLGKLYGYYIDDDNLFPIASSLDLRNFKKQLNIKYPKNVFKIHKNNIKHQRKNTECGMFSMAYQIRWLNGLLKFKELHFKSPYEYPNFVEYIIKDNRIKDESMEESRTYLYRPNFKKYIKDRNITL